MAVLDIVKYGDPRLVAKNSNVVEFKPELKGFVEDMIETMYAAGGVGLAAPQVGINERITVIDVSAGSNRSDLMVLVNPVIVEESGEVKDEEGCLSFPGLAEVVLRPERVVVKAFDAEGRSVEVPGNGFLARALCHEIDHLDSVLFTERMSMLRRDRTLRKARRLAASGW